MFVELIGVDGIDKMLHKLNPKKEENIQKGKKLAKIAANVEEDEYESTDEETSNEKEIIENKESDISSSPEENMKNFPPSSKNPSKTGNRNNRFNSYQIKSRNYLCNWQ